MEKVKIITIYDLKTKLSRDINAAAIKEISAELYEANIIGKIVFLDGDIIYSKETPLELKDLINS